MDLLLFVIVFRNNVDAAAVKIFDNTRQFVQVFHPVLFDLVPFSVLSLLGAAAKSTGEGIDGVCTFHQSETLIVTDRYALCAKPVKIDRGASSCE